MEVTDRKVNRLNYLVKQLKKIRSVQGGLLQLSELASKVQDLTEFYPQLNHVVSSILQADNFYIALENQQQQLQLVYFVDEKDDSTLPEANGIENGITGYVYRTGSSVLCDKSGYLDMVKAGHFSKLGSEPELWFGVPLKRGEHCIGVMAIQSYQKVNAVNEQTVALFENLGLHLMTAINRVKRREFLEQEVKRQTENLQAVNLDLQQQISQTEQAEKLQEVLFQIAQMSASKLNMDAFYQRLHSCLAQLMDVKNCYIALLDDDKLTFPFFVDKYRKHCDSRKMTNGLTEYTIRQKTCQLIDQQRADELELAGLITRKFALPEHVSSCWLGAPLIIDDQVIGVLTVQSYDNQAEYGDKDLQLLNFVSQHIARAIERKLAAQALQNSYDELEKKIQDRTQELRQANLFLRLQVEERRKAERKLFHQANHDSLTGLPNRSCFITKVEQALARVKRHPEHKFALLFIDLDNFKQINDNHGHQAGDEFLIEVSNRLQQAVRENDIVARLGGDEFVILLDVISQSLLAEEVAERIIDVLAQPFELQQQKVKSGASIGIAMSEHGYTDVEAILQDADLAMYQAKSLGRGQFVMFDPSMREDKHPPSALYTLLQSLENKPLPLLQLPVLSQAAQQVSCQLVKIDQAALGVKQENNALFTQGNLQQILDYKLLSQTGQMHDNSNVLTLLPVTAQHLTHLRLTRALIDSIRQLPQPQKVVLLFCETELVELPENQLNNLKQLKRTGVNIAVDNFGRGNMSLGLLTKAPFDFLLFEHSVIKSVAANPAESLLLNTTLDFCSQLKIRPVLTGVDLPQHLQRAQNFNLDLLTGDLITNSQQDHQLSGLQHRA